ncbi:MAG: cupin domain-containing protein [Planctomycetia bacterium]|nr:cupin domain-containing protein [Planctomycetia bacterium]
MEKNPVGEKIRIQRERLELSLEELAEQSHCSVDLLKRLEAGALVPSLSPLLNIARALGIRLGTFLDDMEQNGPVIHRAATPNGMDNSVIRFSGETAETQKPGSASALEFLPLAADKKERHMEPFLIDVHSVENAHPVSSHEGEEFLFVISGTLEVQYGSTAYQLGAGDSIYYDSIVPHHVHAAPGCEAKILAVVYTPF